MCLIFIYKYSGFLKNELCRFINISFSAVIDKEKNNFSLLVLHLDFSLRVNANILFEFNFKSNLKANYSSR